MRALGGAANLTSVGACTTRLRLRLADVANLDEAALRALGAQGIQRIEGGLVHVVLGERAERVAGGVAPH
ncbi:PTS transporter subunit EIIB [Modicisalibacter zincidurans]|uniref:PTS transporter subunit EIIB n=1 Tax=Modicisalibacter zincidurans TaxID=1178777 RepID=UPI0004DB4C8D